MLTISRTSISLAQINSTLTVRRNVFHAFLHALLSSQLVRQRGRVASLTRALGELVAFASGVSRTQQRRAVMMPPHGRGASTLLMGCEVEWLGWAAVRTVCHHKHATIGTPPVVRAVKQRHRSAAQRCEQVSEDTIPLLLRATSSKGFVSEGA